MQEISHLRKRKAPGEELLKGDRLRDLIFLVYLNNRYDKGKNKISELEEIVGYSGPGGIYHALDSSGYFDRKGDEIKLTNLGTQYLNKKILKENQLTNTTGIALVVISLVLLFQYVQWTYFNHVVMISWWGFLPLLIGGLFIRFFTLRLQYWIIKRQKKMI
jgi:hypothetical protein